MVLPLLLCLLAAARAQEPPPPEPPPALTTPWEQPFDLVLEEAKTQYFAGNAEAAEHLLNVLRDRAESGAEAVPAEVAAEAYIYLGELQYKAGRTREALATFEALLRRNPDQPINPYHHPREVVLAYQNVQYRLVQEREAAAAQLPAPVQPLPAWGYLPFGTPQLAQGQPGRGLAYGALQGAFGVTSLAMYTRLRHLNRELRSADFASPEERERIWARYQRERYLIQFPATAGFYLTWGVSVFDADRSWARRHGKPGGPVQVGVGVDGAGASVVVGRVF